MNRKKILLSIDWYLPGGNSGGPVSSYSNLFRLLKDDYEFYVVTRNKDYSSDEVYKGIITDSWIPINENTWVKYLCKKKLNIKNLNKIYYEFNFDSILINGVYSWYFSILPLLILKNKGIKKIISTRGMLNPQAFSSKKFKKLFFIKIANLIGLYRNIFFHATNQFEKKCIEKHILRKKNIDVIPNVPNVLPLKKKQISKITKPIKLISLARISKEKGTLKLIRALAKINIKIKLDLYGSIYDDDYWFECQESIKKLPNNINVSYEGIIARERINDKLLNYDFFISFTEGENFGHSIFESLSVGLPVLISNQTPWKKLRQKKIGWDFNLNNEKEILSVFKDVSEMNCSEYNKLSRNCKLFSNNYFKSVNFKKLYSDIL